MSKTSTRSPRPTSAEVLRELARAITIDAPPVDVWPWLVQVGCLRGGFYSNDLLDNLARVPMSPTAPTERTAFRVDAFETERWLLWRKPRQHLGMGVDRPR